MSNLTNPLNGLTARLTAEIQAYGLLAPLLLRLFAPLLRLLTALESLLRRFHNGTLPQPRPAAPARPQPTRTARTRHHTARPVRSPARKPQPARATTRPATGWTTAPVTPARHPTPTPRPRCRDSPRQTA